MDDSAGDVTKIQDTTHPYNATVHATVGRENSDISGKDNHAPVYTQPLHATVASENKGLGFIICEKCGKEAAKRIYNQRFCCTECRLAWHGYKPTGKKTGK